MCVVETVENVEIIALKVLVKNVGLVIEQVVTNIVMKYVKALDVTPVMKFLQVCKMKCVLDSVLMKSCLCAMDNSNILLVQIQPIFVMGYNSLSLVQSILVKQKQEYKNKQFLVVKNFVEKIKF